MASARSTVAQGALLARHPPPLWYWLAHTGRSGDKTFFLSHNTANWPGMPYVAITRGVYTCSLGR